MIRDDAIALVASRVGQRTDLNTAIQLEMSLVIVTKLEENPAITPWFLRTTKSDLVTVADVDTVALPADFIVQQEDRALQYYDEAGAKWVNLKKMLYEFLDQKYEDAAHAAPAAYNIDGLLIALRPVPDAIYTLRLRYYQHDPLVVANNVETLWLKYAPDLVIAATCATVAKGQLHDMELAASFDSEIAGAWRRLSVLNEAREHTGMTYEMGED
jgi:hypothetical protein